MTKKRNQTPKQIASSAASTSPSELPTFLDHVRELRRRLFWVVAIILLASSGAYPFLDTIINILTAPLGSQQLYYLTPIGGFSFSIQLCLYVGIMAGVPFIMYHLYRYLEPLMGKWRKSAVYYVGFSSLFAAIGLLFAYFISLPSALHFLTGLNLSNIQAMLTVDSYLTFVMTYMLGAALLFQIPLLLLIINNMTPLKPSKLMKLQKFVVVGAFIIAAIISPTPDIMNQLMLALPIVVMYQLGVAFVWIQNRSRARRKLREEQRQARVQQPLFEIKQPPKKPQPLVLPAANKTQHRAVVSPAAIAAATKSPVANSVRKTVYMDGFTAMPAAAVHRRQQVHAQAQVVTAKPQQPQPHVRQSSGVAFDGVSAASVRAAARPSSAGRQPEARAAVRVAGTAMVPAPANRALHVPKRTVDGFMPYRSASAISS